jgi:tripartite-type tricarboxylate transporter receptor subunit TctC
MTTEHFKFHSRRRALGLLAGTTLVGVAGTVGMTGFPTAQAQDDWPSRPIRWIVPYLAGTSPDMTSRIVAEALSDILGQPIVIENKAGAGGNIGAQLAARAKPDGYTWVYSAGPMAANMLIYKAPGFDVMKDFVHVSRMAISDTLVLVHPDSGITTIEELIGRMRANPGGLDYGSGGIGTPSHLGAELMLDAAGVKAVHVPYKGASQSTTALLGKEIDFVLAIFQAAYPLVKQGKLRALAITNTARNPLLPEVRTLAEAGVQGVTLVSFGGVSLPAGTPEPIVRRVNAAVREALGREAVRTKLIEAGAARVGASTPEEFTEDFRAEMARTEAMMRLVGLEAQ